VRCPVYSFSHCIAFHLLLLKNRISPQRHRGHRGIFLFVPLPSGTNRNVLS
jgi:hypothetical protein